jgi:hypothetical protein
MFIVGAEQSLYIPYRSCADPGKVYAYTSRMPVHNAPRW